MQWEGDDQILRNMQAYQDKAMRVVKQVAQYWSAVFEAYAKQNATWIDRTGNARQSLHSFVREAGDDIVELYLAHGMQYGLYLEVRWAGRYAIIWPTIRAHLDEINRMLKAVFS